MACAITLPVPLSLGGLGLAEGVDRFCERAIVDAVSAVSYVIVASPGELTVAAGRDVWDIGLIAAEPAPPKPHN